MNADRRLQYMFGARTDPRAELTAKTEGNKATLRLYDVIDPIGGEYGVSAKEFATVLDGLDAVTDITLHVNSPGGSGFEGIAILNALRSHPARVTAVVDGLAASAASFIAAGADRTLMAKNSQMMIHDAWGICVGNATDLRDIADALDKMSDNLASIYADKAGGTVAEWRDAMKAETWYTAEEAVEAGLADGLVETTEPQNKFDLTVFAHAGRDDAPEPFIPSRAAVEPEPAAAPAAAEPPVRTAALLAGMVEAEAVLALG